MILSGLSFIYKLYIYLFSLGEGRGGGGGGGGGGSFVINCEAMDPALTVQLQ